MTDLNLRFNRDMLTISAPIAKTLARRGVDVERDLEYVSLIEPDTVVDAYRLELAAGAQCITTNTVDITPARLARHRMRDKGQELADAAMIAVGALGAQHVIVEVGPCGLPLDGSSASSLKEHRDQYMRVARLFGKAEFDAFLLSGFTSAVALKCAIAGMRAVSAAPLMATVVVDGQGFLGGGRETLEEALATMVEFQADVCGFCTNAPLDEVEALARRAAAACPNPLMVELRVDKVESGRRLLNPEGPYWHPDTMMEASRRLHRAGVQFLRAAGEATPAYTAILAAMTTGLDVVLD